MEPLVSLGQRSDCDLIRFYRKSIYAAAAAESLQSCPTLCYPIDGSPPGSPVPETLQARTLEWVAISFSNAWKWEVKVKSLSRVRLLATPWTAAHQASPSMGFSRQEYWSGVPLPSPKYKYGQVLKTVLLVIQTGVITSSKQIKKEIVYRSGILKWVGK